MRAKPVSILVTLLFSALALAQAQSSTPAQQAAQANVHHEANFDAERKQALTLSAAHNDLDALPLCTDLARQDPADGLLAECRARGLVTKADTETDPAAAQRDRNEALAEFKRAVSLGDNANYVLAMIDLMTRSSASSIGYQDSQNPQARAALNEGQTAFARRDMKTAFSDYVRASELDPNYYSAKLFAGDACFTSGDYACAGEWFAKAIALDPNRETAYRYWGDALFKSGHSHEAKQKYEQAIVAEPYIRLSWNGLLQWGQITKTQMGSISLPRPKVDLANNKVNVVVNPNSPPAEMMAWLAYAGCRMGDIKKDSAAKPKNASMPAYSPEFEAGCLDLAANAVLDARPKDSELTPDLRALLALQKDGMLECWVLLNSGDPSSMTIYAPYRDAHRDLLITYMDKYIVHEGVAATAAPPTLSDSSGK